MISNQQTQAINTAIERAKEVKSLKDEWTVLNKSQNLTISSRNYKNFESKMIKIEGNIQAKLDTVQQFYFDNNDAIQKNREQCAGIDTLEVMNKDTIISVFKLKAMNNGLPRESLNVRHRIALSINEILIVNGHLDEHPQLPRKEDVIRVDTIINALFLTKIDENNTRMEMFVLNDTKVPIPAQIFAFMANAFLDNFEKDIKTLLSLN